MQAFDPGQAVNIIRPFGGLATSEIQSSDFTSAAATIGSSRAPRRSHVSPAKLIKVLISVLLLSAAVALTTLHFDTSSIFAAARQLSILTMGSILVALLLNVFVAALRLKIIASDIGSPLELSTGVGCRQRWQSRWGRVLSNCRTVDGARRHHGAKRNPIRFRGCYDHL